MVVARYRGLTPRTAHQIAALVRAYLRAKAATEWRKEHYFVVGLDMDSRPLYLDEVSVGLSDQALVDAQGTFATALGEGARGVLLVHNHVGRDVTPSREDVDVARHLQIVGAIVNVPVVDALVICMGRAITSLHGTKRLYSREGLKRRATRLLRHPSGKEEGGI